MQSSKKRNIREIYALKQIDKVITLDRKLLRKQIKDLSALTAITNDGFCDSLVCAEQVLEIFEWLPKGEYTIKFKIT